MALNYKGIDYKTEWLEYPDVAPTLRATGLPPNKADGTAAYTIPTVRFPDGTYVMDSWEIAKEIEKRYPQNSLRLDSEPIPALAGVFAPLAGVLLPLVPRHVLTEKSQPYFNETRKERFGMSLDDYEKEKGGDQAWEAAKEPIAELATVLKKNDGPYILGDQVSYADFVIVSFLHFAKTLGQDVYDRFVAHDKAFDDLYKASARWLERDDH
ncbi:Glutathione S-transferase [Macrophomina phaseolina MS6]|uniref:Glutathione S-transferase n=2 Tax=Macrophomina phaseolina TaxID=35725 RepID=K2RWN5_MACPH|nr:Glutathione S-transferase [Macrophomina phaseolina MS6]